MKIHIVQDDGTVIETIDGVEQYNLHKMLARSELMNEIMVAIERGKRPVEAKMPRSESWFRKNVAKERGECITAGGTDEFIKQAVDERNMRQAKEEVSIKDLRDALAVVVAECPNGIAKAYASSYLTGKMHDKVRGAGPGALAEATHDQVLYVVNNITHWRGDTAKKVRHTLKKYIKDHPPQ